jgi:hypothetical protein
MLCGGELFALVVMNGRRKTTLWGRLTQVRLGKGGEVGLGKGSFGLG